MRLVCVLAISVWIQRPIPVRSECYKERGAALFGFVHNIIPDVSSISACLQQCAQMNDCRSGMYYQGDHSCVLTTQQRSSQPDNFAPSQESVTYFENCDPVHVACDCEETDSTYYDKQFVTERNSSLRLVTSITCFDMASKVKCARFKMFGLCGKLKMVNVLCQQTCAICD